MDKVILRGVRVASAHAGKPTTEQIKVSLDTAKIAELEQLGQKAGKKASAIARIAIEKYLEENRE